VKSIKKFIPSRGLARAFPSKLGRIVGSISFAMLNASAAVTQLAVDDGIVATAQLVLGISALAMIASIQIRGEDGAKSMFAL
jgi:hypothetical protein